MSGSGVDIGTDTGSVLTSDSGSGLAAWQITPDQAVMRKPPGCARCRRALLGYSPRTSNRRPGGAAGWLEWSGAWASLLALPAFARGGGQRGPNPALPSDQSIHERSGRWERAGLQATYRSWGPLSIKVVQKGW